MFGVPVVDTLFLAATMILIIGVTLWRPIPSFLAIMAAACAFGLAAGMSFGPLGKSFGDGFSAKIYSPGLVIVGACFIAALAEYGAASDRLATMLQRVGPPTRIAAILGLIAGLGASPASAFAVLIPLRQAIGGATMRGRQSASIALALATSGSHAVLLFAPVPVAATAILGAPWSRVALFGVPVAILLAALGAALAARLPLAKSTAAPPGFPPAIAAAPGDAAPRPRTRSVILLFATAVPLMLLIVQSLGDIPSEPLGGGPAREFILGLGRPVTLFIASLGIMCVGSWRQSMRALGDPGWAGPVLGHAAGIVLAVGAAGGFQKLCQDTGMAELLGERLLDSPFGGIVRLHGGVLIPFLAAAVIKTLQGSSLVAAITAAGMVQPMLGALGLDDGNGAALAALAIGAGAMTVSHFNDDYFWLVTISADLSPVRGLANLSVGTLLQGIVAMAAIFIIALLVSVG